MNRRQPLSPPLYPWDALHTERLPSVFRAVGTPQYYPASQRAAGVATHPDAKVAACPYGVHSCFVDATILIEVWGGTRRKGAAEGQVQAHLRKRRNFSWEDLISFLAMVGATTAVVVSLPWQSF